MKEKKSVLIISEDGANAPGLPGLDPCLVDIEVRDTFPGEGGAMGDTPPDVIVFSPGKLRETLDWSGSPDHDQLLDMLSTAVLTVDMEQNIASSNASFRHLVGNANPDGQPFYEVLSQCELGGPDFAPFRTVRREEKATTTSLAFHDRYYETQYTPFRAPGTGRVTSCIVEMRDTTELTRIDQTLRRLQTTGRQLVDLSPEELRRMSPDDRIELLKSRIEKSMRNILKYDVVEFRLLDKTDNRLVPLLAFGLPPEAVQRELYATSNGNGITGYVAYNKVCYYCEDTTEHDMYLPGASGARSSLTVPLLYHNEVIGTCNVESRQVAAFTERDMYFLQLFTRDVAVALHTFDLLSYESGKAVTDSIQAILSSVSLPIDDIVQKVSILLHGDRDDEKTRLLLEQILRSARGIKEGINVYGARKGIETDQVIPSEYAMLKGRSILVIDQDESILRSAHEMLEAFHCAVETAKDAITGLNMIKTSEYDVIITEIKPLGGMSAYQLMLRIFDLCPGKKVLPIVFSAEFGYDGGHTIVNARLRGLLGTIYRPLIRKQLLATVKKVIETCGKRDAAGNLIPPHAANGGTECGEQEDSGTGNGAKRGVSPTETSRVAGFYQKEAPRFNEWARQFNQSFSENNRKEDGPDNEPALDAT